MKIIITGSHFTPAQAVIEELKKDKNVQIVYFGRKYTREGDKSPSVESQVLPGLGVKFIPVIAGRLQRSFTIHTLPSLIKIPVGFLQAFYLLLRERPNVILSFGGYSAVPTVISAWLLSIPIIIHEQTLVPGLANTISSWFADKIAVSFKENEFFKKNRVVVTGNPMRKELFGNTKSADFDKILADAKKEKLPVILITGGNQGSHLINQTVFNCLDQLNKKAYIIHQTGDSKFNDFEKLEEARQRLKYSGRYKVRKWIDGGDFGVILKNTDLVVSRAGINTLLELAYFSVPTLVIPIPYIYKNEQMVNARFFEKLGLVKILLQDDTNAKTLEENINQMIDRLPQLRQGAEGAKSLANSDAAKRLALETMLLVDKK